MKKAYLAVLLAAALAGCAYNVTLFPRGGGDQATGTFEVGSQTMTVKLNGETYTGNVIAGSTVGIGTVGTKTATMVGSTNQRSALLKGPNGLIRCEYVIQVRGGNGTCVDSREKVYDLGIAPQ